MVVMEDVDLGLKTPSLSSFHNRGEISGGDWICMYMSHNS